MASVLCVATALTLAACGSGSGTSHRHQALTVAQCTRATKAIGQITPVVSPFAAVRTRSDLLNANMQVASDSGVTGSEDSDLAALSAAATSAPLSLARELRQAKADYAAFSAANDSVPADPQTVAQAARYTMTDIAAVTTACAHA